MAAKSELTLGTIFSGKLDDSFGKAVKRLETLVKGLNKSLAGIKKAGGTQALADLAKQSDAAVQSVANLEKHMSSAGSELTEFQKAMGRASNESKEFQDALAKLGAGKSGTALKTVESNLRKVEKAVQETAQKMNKAGKDGDTWAKSVNRLDLYNQSLDKTLKSTANGIQLVSKRSASASSSTKKLGGDFTILGKQIGSVDGAMNRLLAAFKVTAAYGAASTAIYSVVTAFRSGFDAIVDYDQGLKNLQAITGATDREVTAMGETIKQVARDTKFSTSEVADGMTLLGQAGLDAGESITAMRDTALLATGTLSDMQTSTDLVSTTIRAFGLDASESGRIVDVMANAVNKSKLTIDKLRTAFNYVAATASQAGLSLEETAGTMMTLANSGLRASTIGTGLRQVLSRVVKPSESMSRALASVGLNLDDLNPKTVGWSGTISSLAKILYDSDTKTVNMAKAFQLFGLRGAQAAAVIVDSYVSGQYANAMENVYEIGTAEQMAAKQAEGLGVKLKNLVDRAKNVAVAFGEAGATGAIKTFLDAIRGALSAVESFVGSIAGSVIVQMTALVTSFKLATTAGKAFLSLLAQTSVVEAFTFSFKGLNAAIAGKSGLTGVLAMAGLYIKSFLSSLGPLKIALGLVVAGVLAYREALAKQIKDAELAVTKNDQIVKSLESYQFALDDAAKKLANAKEGTSQVEIANNAYIATLKRLIEEHPKLKDKIKLTTEALEENSRALDKFASTAHLERLKAISDLVNEYGDALERSKVWDGYINSLMQGFKMLWGDITNVVGSLWDVDVAIDKIAKRARQTFPVISGLLKSLAAGIGVVKDQLVAWYEADKRLVQESYQYWKEYFIGQSDGSKEIVEWSKKIQEVLEHTATAYATMGDKAKMSYGAIKRELESTTNFTNKQIDFIIKKVAELRDKSTLYTTEVLNEIQKSTQEMTAEWQKYYDQLDDRGQFALGQEKARLESRAKEYAEFLAKKYGKEEEAAAIIAAKMVQWWADELQRYQAQQAKKEESLNKSLEKREAAYQKYADKIKAIEDKLSDDQKALRQVGMTDAQKANDDLIDAKQKLSDAQKAVAEATTAKELEEALKQVKNAREAYSEIVRAANQASDLEVKAQKKTTEGKKAERTREIQWWATENASALEKEIIANNTAIKLLKEERALYTKWHGEKATERANADESAADRTKQAAKNAFAVITDLLKELQAKFEKPVELDVKTDDSKTKIEVLKDSADTASDTINDEKEFKVTDSATPVLEGISTLAEGTGRIFDKEKEYRLNADGTTTKLGEIKKTAEESAQAITKEKEFHVNTDQALQTISEVTTDIRKVETEAAKEKPVNVSVSAARNNVADLNTKLTSLTTKVWDATLGIIVTGTDKVSAAIKLLQTVTSKTWESFHTITVTGLDKLKSALAYHTKLDGLSTDSYHTVHVDGEGSTKKPISEKIAEVKKWLGELGQAAVDAGSEVVFSFKGSGSSTTGISEKIAEIKAGMGSIASTSENAASETSSAWQSAFEKIMTGVQGLVDAVSALVDKMESKLSEVNDMIVRTEHNFTGTTTRYYIDPKTGRVAHKEMWLRDGGSVMMDDGGKLSGYGGGDTVPAMLEPGEFVIRKEAVKNYGTGLFDQLNSMVAKFSNGGSIRRIPTPAVQKMSVGGLVMSNQLHTINLSINNTPHKLYGDEQAVHGLIKTLRREQLVAA
jgi:TP901 family phage tail tape measure protein